MDLYKEKMEQIEHSQKVCESQKQALNLLKPLLSRLNEALEDAEEKRMYRVWGVYLIFDDTPCFYFDYNFMEISEDRLMELYFNPIRKVLSTPEGRFSPSPIERSISGTSLKYRMEVRDYEGRNRAEFMACVHDSPDCELVEEEVTTKRYKLKCKGEE